LHPSPFNSLFTLCKTGGARPQGTEGVLKAVERGKKEIAMMVPMARFSLFNESALPHPPRQGAMWVYGGGPRAWASRTQLGR